MLENYAVSSELIHVQQINSQYHLPELGKNTAYQENRNGVAARFPNPAVHKRVAVDLALVGDDDPLLSDLELHILKAAKPHDIVN
jgi:hypothetical protein